MYAGQATHARRLGTILMLRRSTKTGVRDRLAFRKTHQLLTTRYSKGLGGRLGSGRGPEEGEKERGRGRKRLGGGGEGYLWEGTIEGGVSAAVRHP